MNCIKVKLKKKKNNKKTTSLSQHPHLHRKSRAAVTTRFCGLIYNISRWKSIVLFHDAREQLEATAKAAAWCGSYRWCLDSYHSTNRRQSSSSPLTRSVQAFTQLHSCPPPPSIQNAHLWVAVGRLGLIDGCLCERLWVLEERGWAAVPVLTILGQFSWIKSNLLTRKRKQVNWPESGHKNFYCCGWNVRNVATLFECDVGLAFIILRRLWVTWSVKANEHVQPRMTRAKTLWVNILSNILTHALYQADEERSEAAIKQ